MNVFAPKPQPKTKNGLLASLTRQRFDFGLGNKTAIQYVPFFAFLTILGVLYIGNNYSYERLMSKISAEEKEVEALRVDYSAIKYDYIKASQPTEISKRVKGLGLVENKDPFVKIKVKAFHQKTR